jgi:putative membrane protein
MANGFLGYDSSFMLDVVVCALALIVPALLWSLYEVKYRRRFTLHRNLQMTLGAVLLLAVAAFEVDMQLVHGGWENVVNKPGQSPRLSGAELETASTVLAVHLVFAISTPLLWAVTLVLAWRNFPHPPQPGPHSRLHKTLGWLSTVDITLTSVTGLAFYYVAFVR